MNSDLSSTPWLRPRCRVTVQRGASPISAQTTRWVLVGWVEERDPTKPRAAILHTNLRNPIGASRKLLGFASLNPTHLTLLILRAASLFLFPGRGVGAAVGWGLPHKSSLKAKFPKDRKGFLDRMYRMNGIELVQY